LDEFRGANFALGGDSDIISVPNILRKFSPNLVGDSKGTHLIEVCYGVLCPSDYVPKSDQLNAAQSGAQALNVDKQGRFILFDFFFKEMFLFILKSNLISELSY